MKKLFVLLTFMVIFLMTTIQEVKAMSSSALLKEDFYQTWSDLIEEINNLNQYQVTYEIISQGNRISRFDILHQPHNHLVNIYGQILSQDEDKIEIQIIGDDQFEKVFINLPSILTTILKNNFNINTLSNYQDYYVPVNTRTITDNNEDETFLSSILYLPNLNEMKEVKGDNFIKLKNFWFYELNRFEIPKELYAYQGNFHLKYQIEINEDKRNIVGINHRMLVDQNLFGLTQEFMVLQEVNPFTMIFSQPFIDYHFSLEELIKRLIGTQVILNPEIKSFEIIHKGLIGEIDLNISKSDAAVYENNIEIFKYKIKENNVELLQIDQLKVLSLEELLFMINRRVN